MRIQALAAFYVRILLYCSLRTYLRTIALLLTVLETLWKDVVACVVEPGLTRRPKKSTRHQQRVEEREAGFVCVGRLGRCLGIMVLREIVGVFCRISRANSADDDKLTTQCR